MKKLFLLTITATLALFAGCDKRDGGDGGDGGEEPGQTVVDVTGVVLDRNSLTLHPEGLTETLVATVLPADATNRNVSWMSSRPEVASVDGNGVVSPLSIGTAIIVVTTEEGEYTDECTVKVVIPPTGVSLDMHALTLVKGQTATLVATMMPANAYDKTCVWESSDETVATVAGGVVTGRGTGNATITVRTVLGGLKDECTVTMQDGVMLNTVVWAERNVGLPGQFSAAPSDVGMFYKWGQKVGWSNSDPLRDSNGGTVWDTSSVDGTTPWPVADDPCPAGWRIPTLDEVVWLTFYRPEDQNRTDNGAVKWEVAEMDGVLGVRFTNMEVPEASIFMPTDGYRVGVSNGAIASKSDAAAMAGATMYWASDAVQGSGTEGHRLYLSRAKNQDGSARMTVEPMAITRRSFAFGVRCVKKNVNQ